MKKVESDKIKKRILKLIADNKRDIVRNIEQTFSVSKTTVYNYLKTLTDEGLIVRDVTRPSGYALVSDGKVKFFMNDGTLREDAIFDAEIFPYVKDFEKNVIDDWRYAFCEMMNNAIEHSNADIIDCCISKNCLYTSVTVSDNGIGIFKNIQKYVRETRKEEISTQEAASMLLAGKFTTNSDCHSGEGIFFTSHLMDRFFILSGETLFSRTNFDDSQINLSPEMKNDRGTMVYMKLENNSRKKLRDVFDRFSDVDNGFCKTTIPMAHMFPSLFPVSRSEARRLCSMIEKFENVTLDFTDIDDIGQAFTHELFIVFAKKFPSVNINVEKANKNVLGMISRVKNTK